MQHFFQGSTQSTTVIRKKKKELEIPGFFFGRKRLTGRSEKTDIARPKMKQRKTSKGKRSGEITAVHAHSCSLFLAVSLDLGS